MPTKSNKSWQTVSLLQMIYYLPFSPTWCFAWFPGILVCICYVSTISFHCTRNSADILGLHGSVTILRERFFNPQTFEIFSLALHSIYTNKCGKETPRHCLSLFSVDWSDLWFQPRLKSRHGRSHQEHNTSLIIPLNLLLHVAHQA